MMNVEYQTGDHLASKGYVRQPVPISLLDLAAQEYERADGVASEAIASLSLILSQDDVRVSIAEQVIKEAAVSAIRRELLNDRASVMRAAANGATRASVVALASGISRSILDFPLSDGTKLRHATRADVERQVARYQSMASEITKRAAWLVAILDAMGDAATVGDAISDDVAIEIYRSA